MRIQKLDPLVAQRIAAGEVIDRPARSFVNYLTMHSMQEPRHWLPVSLMGGDWKRSS